MSQYNDVESLEKAMAVAAPRDRAVTIAITDAWLALPGIDHRRDGIVWEATAIKTSKTGAVWHANGRVIATGMPVVLGCGGIRDAAKEPLDRRKYQIVESDKDRTLNFLGNVRLKVVATIATEKYLYVETEDELADLYTLIECVYNLQDNDKDTFPAFSLRIPGDTSSASIFECLYSLGSFVASMGNEVVPTAKSLAEVMNMGDYKLKANLCIALAEFWPALHIGDYFTYDELFLKHGDSGYASCLPRERLLPMKNLLIDEFQDISGQIVRWIKSIHSVLAEHGDKPSLLAVGDDWQSVYGWRGSDPEYIIRFNEHFGESEQVVMRENYRSGQHIINTAELLVKHLTNSALQKHGVAASSDNGVLGVVELCNGGDDDIVKLVQQLRAEDPAGNLFILSRTNEGLGLFRRRFSKDKKVTMLTMHRAKGLEADYVVIKGDCYYANTSPLRNAIYRLAGMWIFYDTAQRDEALRLAYVAITRAKKRVYWFGEPSRPEGAFRLLASNLAEGECSCT